MEKNITQNNNNYNKIIMLKLLALTLASAAGSDNSDAFKTVEQIVVENGFKWQDHEVTTDDGYILKLGRVPA